MGRCSSRAHRRLHADDVLTYVVGVGKSSPVVSATLGNMAMAGGTDHAYSAVSQLQLAAALELISSRVTKCTWSANTLLGAGDSIEVRIGQDVVPFKDGWTWARENEGAFSLVGAWCDRAVAGETVAVKLACH